MRYIADRIGVEHVALGSDFDGARVPGDLKDAAGLPKLVGARSYDNDWFTVRETVLRYLPETLANYVALPPAFRATQPLQGGQRFRKRRAQYFHAALPQFIRVDPLERPTRRER